MMKLSDYNLNMKEFRSFTKEIVSEVSQTSNYSLIIKSNGKGFPTIKQFERQMKRRDSASKPNKYQRPVELDLSYTDQ